jgi:CheY-like chemotaxis protein
VLLVDDEEIVRAATADLIRDLGHRVEEAGGGAEALAKLESGQQFDAVVTDYMMPAMDGGALARLVAKSHPALPVLLITGYTGPTNDVLHLPRLAKPFGRAEIAEALAGLFADDAKILRFPGRPAKS